jgi:hypothetical protein
MGQRESVCCLLVLDSVTSTPQLIRQPKPRDTACRRQWKREHIEDQCGSLGEGFKQTKVFSEDRNITFWQTPTTRVEVTELRNNKQHTLSHSLTFLGEGDLTLS